MIGGTFRNGHEFSDNRNSIKINELIGARTEPSMIGRRKHIGKSPMAKNSNTIKLNKFLDANTQMVASQFSKILKVNSNGEGVGQILTQASSTYQTIPAA